MENKRERFKRLAENRTNKIIKMLELLGNCANTSNYEYTNEDVKIIFSAIEEATKEAKSKFNSKKDKKITL